MRKLILYFVVLILTVGAGWYLIRKGRAGTLHPADIDFSPGRPESVRQVEIAAGSKMVMLGLRKDGWWVNDSFPGDSIRIMNFLTLAGDIRLYAPVAKVRFNELDSLLSSKGIRVMYKGNMGEIKTYTVITLEQGTQMKTFLKLRKKIFEVHIPGQSFHAGRFFSVSPADWRSRVLFDFSMAEMDEVSMIYPGHPLSSYRIKQISPGNFLLFDGNNRRMAAADTFRIVSYFQLFEQFHFDRFACGIDAAQFTDQDHVFTLRISSTKKHSVKVAGYKRFTGTPPAPDPDHLYLVIPSGEVAIARYLALDPLLKDLQWFRKN